MLRSPDDGTAAVHPAVIPKRLSQVTDPASPSLSDRSFAASLDALEEDIAALHADDTRVQGKRESAETERPSFDRTMQNTNDILAKHIVGLEQILNGLDRQSAALIQKSERLSRAVHALQVQFGDYESLNAMLTARETEVQKPSDDGDDPDSRARREIRDYERRIRETEHSIDATEERIAQARLRAAQLRSATMRYRGVVSESGNRIALKFQALSETIQSIAETKAAVRSAKAQKQKMRQMIHRLSIACAALPEYGALVQERRRLTEHFRETEQSLQRLSEISAERTGRVATLDAKIKRAEELSRLIDEFEIKILARASIPRPSHSPLASYHQELKARIAAESEKTEHLESVFVEKQGFPVDFSAGGSRIQTEIEKLGAQLQGTKRLNRRIARKCESECRMLKAMIDERKALEGHCLEVKRELQIDTIRHQENVSLLFEYMQTAPGYLRKDILSLEQRIQQKQKGIMETKQRIITGLDAIASVTREYGLFAGDAVLFVGESHRK
jgi:hypothetical protein